MVVLRTRSRIRTCNNDVLTAAPLPLGHPGMNCVEYRGVEPRAAGLQSEPVHQHVPHGAAGRTRTDISSVRSTRSVP